MTRLPRQPIHMVGVLFLALSSSCGSGATTQDVKPAQVAMAEEWVAAAVAGDFARAAALGYGESGEPEALDALAETVSAYADEYGEPVVTVGIDVHPSSGAELGFVCIRLDYDSFVLEGGLAFRTWKERGLKVWEYRGGLEGCRTEGAHVTTTLPPVPTS